MLVVLEHHDVPPSMNTYAHAHWRRFHGLKQQWQQVFETALFSNSLPSASFVIADAELRFSVHRRRDEGNFRVLLEKALGDALVNGSWLADDTPEHFRFQRVHFDDSTGPARTRVYLDWTEVA